MYYAAVDPAILSVLFTLCHNCDEFWTVFRKRTRAVCWRIMWIDRLADEQELPCPVEDYLPQCQLGAVGAPLSGKQLCPVEDYLPQCQLSAGGAPLSGKQERRDAARVAEPGSRYFFFRLRLQVKHFGSSSTYKSSAPTPKNKFWKM